MIIPALFKKPVAIDREIHRSLRKGEPRGDWSAVAGLNSMFIAAAEFGDVAIEYPIVFVNAGTDEQGQAQVAPIAVLGLKPEENLYVDKGMWRADYVPALLRAYPFGIARVDAGQVVIVIDEAWAGWSQTEGAPLFDESGEPGPELQQVRGHLEQLETEIQRTRLFGKALLDAGLLTSMRFEATMADGQKITAEGFFTIDEKKLAELPEAKIVEMHRNGALSLIHAHQVSMRLMRRLADWRSQRAAQAGETTSLA